ncbi:amidohydrolase family protein [Xanthomonas sp. XNM01]|uniref:amidohydrolase family protein n=1 Tax=Xanthomonas sp. XNM01 TaxID=2769289 RepID=UPI001CE0C959|nr:amidohydrolase family protein [Xanthomonas sp. XNM01]
MKHWTYASAMAACLSAVMALPQAASAQDLAITGARVIAAPDAAPIENGTVLVRDGRIAAVGTRAEVRVPEGVPVIDGSGGTLVAGFWNSHVHFLTPETRTPATTPADVLEDALQQMLTRWGFTTVFDIGSFDGVAAGLRTRIAAGEVRGPDILSVGLPYFPENGTPYYVAELFESLGVRSAEVADVPAAKARAARELADGADGVKLFAGAIVGGPVDVLPMRVDIATALVEQAHAVGKPAFAHPTNREGLEVSLASGVDVLAHSAPQAGAWDAALVQRLRAADMALIPTLALFDVEMRREGAPETAIDRVVGQAVQQVQALHAAGGEILFGTDIGYMHEADTTREIALLAQAGLDWRAILTSLTTAPATRFGQADRKGRIAPGLQADLVLLDGDPTTDVVAYSNVRQTFRAGVAVYRKP